MIGFFSWLFAKSSEHSPSSSKRDTPSETQTSKRARVIWRENSFPMNAVGESHYQDRLERICDGHNRSGHELEVDAELVREPTNPHDANAIAVNIGKQVVGYLSSQQASRISAQMAEDRISRAVCRAKVVGGWRTNQHDEGYFGVYLAVPNRGWIDFGLGKKSPATRNSAPPAAPATKASRPISADEGPLKGKRLAIWGAPASGPEAQELAALGAHIMAGVGKSTNLVVQVDDELTPGMKGSATYKTVQEMIADGNEVAIVTLSELRKTLPKP